MSITEKVKELAVPVLDTLGLELFDLMLQKGGGHQILCILIDKEGGVTLDDCRNASREIGTLLDVKDVVPGSYNLEVSSPGINRPIRNEQDFQIYEGSKIKVKLYTAISNQKTFVGINRGVAQKILSLEVSPDREIQIPISEIAKANLEIDL